jgi:hypothetical protein
MPDQYDWGLWPGWPGKRSESLPHSYVYRRDVGLAAGTTYHFQTRNLRSGWFGRPDPVMYLVRGNDIVAFNDDYTGYASEIIYTPNVAGIHKLVIRAFTTSTPGYCDLYQGVGGAAPSLLASDVMFGGTYIWVRWKLGEWFETGLNTIYFTTNGLGLGGGGSGAGDPYLFLIYPESRVGSKMYWNDDGAGSLNSKIEPPAGGTGTLILGSYSRYTDGMCALALVGQSYKAPWMSPAPWASVAEPVPHTPTVTKYVEELKRQKPDLEKLSPEERDQQVLKLQRRMLSEEEIRQQRAPMPAVSTELVRRQGLFAERYQQMEKDLAQMSYGERSAELARVKRETMGREYSEPELEEEEQGR